MVNPKLFMFEWMKSVVLRSMISDHFVGIESSLEELVMRQLSSMSLLGILAFSAAGCSALTGSAPPSPQPSASPAPIAAATPAPVIAQKPATDATGKPMVTKVPGNQAASDTSLIQSTNPDARLQEIQKGRTDPFSLLAISPDVTLPPSLVVGPTKPIRRLPPPPPQPDLARAVEVTGVVQIGNTIQAILKAPNEPSSRYVRAGQRLSNGQVLVKRIILGMGGNPIVVLEEHGIEVNKTLSERTASAV
ncbi:hypothetical protein [Neosynechococcus sphagnicola]|uniref:hypothetical protein n=1 Tax=Neosynechococcus sphagnicola TaxID=1501145 RepID=UPI000691C489|nr:hypothetical protein [Neosynechococcus sphagnicola]